MNQNEVHEILTQTFPKLVQFREEQIVYHNFNMNKPIHDDCNLENLRCSITCWRWGW